MKKLAALIFLAITLVTSFGSMAQPVYSVVYAQKKNDEKPRKKDQPGPPVVKDKREKENPPPRKPRKP